MARRTASSSPERTLEAGGGSACHLRRYFTAQRPACPRACTFGGKPGQTRTPESGRHSHEGVGQSRRSMARKVTIYIKTRRRAESYRAVLTCGQQGRAARGQLSPGRRAWASSVACRSATRTFHPSLLHPNTTPFVHRKRDHTRRRLLGSIIVVHCPVFCQACRGAVGRAANGQGAR